MFVTPELLSWATERLREWGQESPKRPTMNLFRFFLLKSLGVAVGDTATAPILETADFSGVCQRFLRVSWRGEETGALTGGKSRYYNPFTAKYLFVEGSDYAIGTMWTRCETWRATEKIIDFETVGTGRGAPRKIAFTPNYVERLSEGLERKRIPAIPLALYLFRRPDDSRVNEARLSSLSDFGAVLREVFSITDDEEESLLDFSDDEPPNPELSIMQMSRREVLEVITSVESFSVNAVTVDEEFAAAPAAVRSRESIDVNWVLSQEVYENPCGLVGQGDPLRRALAALEARKHIVLVGPPGTGKTELAVCICDSLGVEFDVVTATSDWTTFDTIGGYFPSLTAGEQGGSSGGLDFSPGIISQSLLDRRWLVVDELNRADVDKAFGELFTLLSGKTVRLPFKKRKDGQLLDVVLGGTADSADDAFVIPIWDDWRLIGTMNTFDKASLFQLSYAFMRRFAFVDIPIPSQAQYVSILRRRAETSATGEHDVFRRGVLELLESLFAPPTDQGLAALSLLVGPAIPLDILQYAERRVSRREGIDSKTVVLEGVEMYLYPQFEGKERQHREIVSAVKTALALDDDEMLRTDRILATWTGHESTK